MPTDCLQLGLAALRIHVRKLISKTPLLLVINISRNNVTKEHVRNLSQRFIAMVALSQRHADKGLHLSRPFLFFLLLIEGFAEVQDLTGVRSDMYIT